MSTALAFVKFVSIHASQRNAIGLSAGIHNFVKFL